MSVSSCKKEVLEYKCDTVNPSEINVEVNGDLDVKFNFALLKEFEEYTQCLQNCTDSDLDCIMTCSTHLSYIAAGGAFSIACHIENKTNSPISFTLEAGDWFMPADTSYQPMLCARDITITVKANKSETEIIPVYCLASGKNGPSEETVYSFCNHTVSNTCVNEIMNILKNKDLSSVTFTQTSQIQGVIWDCTDGNTVDLSLLDSLPNN